MSILSVENAFHLRISDLELTKNEFMNQNFLYNVTYMDIKNVRLNS